MTVQTCHRQFGSKVRSAAFLLSLVPADVRVWIEGFCGTAAVTLAKPPHPAEHLNDLNGDIVNLFDVLRDDAALERLCHLIDLTPWAQEEFIRCRDHVIGVSPDDAPDPVERARRFLVASWQAIGGKQHNKTSWRLDTGRSWIPGTWERVPLRLQAAARRLKHTHIHRRHILDLIEMFDRAGPAALMFLDPPYPRDTLATHERMYAVDMTDDEHRQLAERLRTVRCRVLLTMSQGTIYSEVLHDWHVRPFTVRGLTNVVKAELAMTNYPPPAVGLFGG